MLYTVQGTKPIIVELVGKQVRAPSIARVHGDHSVMS